MCKIFDSHSHKEIQTIGNLRNYIRCSHIRNFSSNLYAAIGNTDGSIKSGLISQFHLTKNGISKDSLRAIYYFDENVIVCGDDGGYLHLVDFNTNQIIPSYKTGAGITAILLLKNQKAFLCGYRDGFIRKFYLNKDTDNIFQLAIEKKIHTSIVGDIVQLDRNAILSCSDDRTIRCSFIDSLSLLY